MAIRIDVIGCGLALGLAITAWSGAGRAADDGEEINSPPKTTEVAGCHSDQDCKGSRVCDDGKCVADKSLGDSDDEHQKKGVTAFNAIYAELLGPGIIWSVNYERRFGQSGFAARAGLGYVSVTASGGGESASVSLTTIPLTASYLGIGGYYSKFELGAGGVIAIASAAAGGLGSTTSSASGVGGAATILAGYRYQSDGGGFQFRVGISPLLGPGGVLPWGYLSLGGAFGR
jgi:hypothetical protein